MSYVGIHRSVFKRIGLLNFLEKFGITFMSTGLPRLGMAIVKLNKLQRMPENMSQLLPTKLTSLLYFVIRKLLKSLQERSTLPYLLHLK